MRRRAKGSANGLPRAHRMSDDARPIDPHIAPVPLRAMQIRVLRNECCGHGECNLISPDVFTIDVTNRCVVLDPEADTPEKVREAAEACPCMAIVLLDDDGNEIFP